MVSAPRLLLCDEVTSGLDPKAESEVAQLLVQLARGGDRLVLSVTHSLQHLSLCDSVVVLVPRADRLPRRAGVSLPLLRRGATRGSLPAPGAACGGGLAPFVAEESGILLPAVEDFPRRLKTRWSPRMPRIRCLPCGAQTSVLLARRCRLFFRDRGQLFLQLALLLGFPMPGRDLRAGWAAAAQELRRWLGQSTAVAAKRSHRARWR